MRLSWSKDHILHPSPQHAQEQYELLRIVWETWLRVRVYNKEIQSLPPSPELIFHQRVMRIRTPKDPASTVKVEDRLENTI